MLKLYLAFFTSQSELENNKQLVVLASDGSVTLLLIQNIISDCLASCNTQYHRPRQTARLTQQIF